MKGQKSFGFFILALAAIAGFVSIALYGSSLNTSPKAYGFLIAAAVVAVVSLLLGLLTGNKIFNWAGVCSALLMAAGLGWSLTVMVDAIGYVVSGLYQFSTLQTYITFAICGGIAWFLFLVSGFTGILKK